MKCVNTKIAVLALFLVSASCKTTSYFDTPNSIKNFPATVYLTSGDSLKGKVSVTTNYVKGGNLKVLENGQNQPTKLKLQEVVGYKANNKEYTLKEIKTNTRSGATFSFMEKLPANNSLQLYKATVKHMIYDKNKPSKPVINEYYFSLPREKGNIVYSLKELETSKNFDDRIYQLIASHPELNKKLGLHNYKKPIPREKRSEVILQLVQDDNATE